MMCVLVSVFEMNYALQQKNSHIWSGTLLMVRANVCEIHNWPEWFVYVCRFLALWTGWCINIMASNLPYILYHGGIGIEIHMHRIYNCIHIYIYIYWFIYIYLLLFLSICFVWCTCYSTCLLQIWSVGWHIWLYIDGFDLCVSSLVINVHTRGFIYTCINICFRERMRVGVYLVEYN